MDSFNAWILEKKIEIKNAVNALFSTQESSIINCKAQILENIELKKYVIRVLSPVTGGRAFKRSQSVKHL